MEFLLDSADPQEIEEVKRPPKIEEYLQDAIKEDLDVFGVSHKDVVFSHLAVHLKEASVRLLRAIPCPAFRAA